MSLQNAKWLIFQSIILCFLQVPILRKVQNFRIKTGIHISVIFHNLQLLVVIKFSNVKLCRLLELLIFM